MSNTRVTPDIKGRAGVVRAETISSEASKSWSDSPVIPGPHVNTTTPLPDTKISSRLPLLRLNRVIAFVDENIALNLCVPTLATVAGMSHYYFCRAFKESTGITPHRYVLHRRMEEAKRLLEERTISLLQVAHQVGFTDQSQFTRVFHKMVGTTPSKYRKNEH